MKLCSKIRKSTSIVMVVWIIALIGIWEIGAIRVGITKRTPENVLPHIYQIIGAIFDTKHVSNNMTATMLVLTAAKATLLRAGLGFLIGGSLGFVLALMMKLSKVIEKMTFPYLMLIQMIPILGMAPIVLAVTHDIGVSRIIIAAILTFYPVATNTLAGLNSVSKEKYELMYSYAATKRTIYQKVLIPSCIPYLFTGLKIAAPMAITASILVDTLQGDMGLGSMLSQSLKHAMSIYVFWLIILFSGVVGIFSSYFMSVIETKVSPQKRALKKSRKNKGDA